MVISWDFNGDFLGFSVDLMVIYWDSMGLNGIDPVISSMTCWLENSARLAASLEDSLSTWIDEQRLQRFGGI